MSTAPNGMSECICIMLCATPYLLLSGWVASALTPMAICGALFPQSRMHTAVGATQNGPFFQMLSLRSICYDQATYLANVLTITYAPIYHDARPSIADT
jgi:hypothetical protein